MLTNISMTDYNITANRIIYNSCNECIFIKRTTPKFIVYDSYDDYGILKIRNLKRKILYNKDYLYIKLNGNYIFVIEHFKNNSCNMG
jgi:hypothetical protein